jgi:uncharacterized RmlC-like cupin family protein
MHYGRRMAILRVHKACDFIYIYAKLNKNPTITSGFEPASLLLVDSDNINIRQGRASF